MNKTYNPSLHFKPHSKRQQHVQFPGRPNICYYKNKPKKPLPLGYRGPICSRCGRPLAGTTITPDGQPVYFTIKPAIIPLGRRPSNSGIDRLSPARNQTAPPTDMAELIRKIEAKHNVKFSKSQRDSAFDVLSMNKSD